MVDVVMLEISVTVLMKCYQNRHDFTQAEAFSSATSFAPIGDEL